MFAKIKSTAFPPTQKPIMVWDGDCGFCKFWIIHWYSKTKDRIEYTPYQKIASHFSDIPLKEFQKASRLIDTDGKIYSGPDSAFKSFTFFEQPLNFWHRWYTRSTWFALFCDRLYNWIAKHRSLMFKVTTLLFGRNPNSLKHFWLGYLSILGLLIWTAVKVL